MGSARQEKYHLREEIQPKQRALGEVPEKVIVIISNSFIGLGSDEDGVHEVTLSIRQGDQKLLINQGDAGKLDEIRNSVGDGSSPYQLVARVIIDALLGMQVWHTDLTKQRIDELLSAAEKRLNS